MEFRDIYDDFLTIGKLSVLIKETDSIQYDFDFRNIFNCSTVFSNTPFPIMLRIGAISDYKQVETIIRDLGMSLLVSEEEHIRCSLIENWYPLLKEKTPFTKVYDTLPELEELKEDFKFPIFVKGNRQTSKHTRSKSIIENAEQYRQLRETWNNDPILFWQKVAVREYVPLYEIDSRSFPDMLPISYEFRFFYYDKKFMTCGPYWTLGERYLLEGDELRHVLKLTDWAVEKLKVPFLAIDVAKTASGDWIIIEVNDGQESGYAEVNPFVLWRNIYNASISSSRLTTFEIVKKCIDEWDPYGLLETGCPEDEFDIESSMITGKISDKSTFEEINQIVSDVFSRQFEAYLFQPHQCIEVSQKIYKLIQDNCFFGGKRNE